MRRFTTPTIPLTVDAVITADDVRVTLTQGNKKITKKSKDGQITVTAGENDTTLIDVPLTQAETGYFVASQAVMVMVNWIDSDGGRNATDEGTIQNLENLLNEVIVYGD